MAETNENPSGQRIENIKTYHCLCNTFILATTYDLIALPSRASPAQDQALILPFSFGSLAGSDAMTDGESSLTAGPGLGGAGYSYVTNITQDAKPVIVRREDGFEKRRLQRCKRCKLVIGYQLDETQFSESDIRADQLWYLLPGGLVSTSDMRESRPAVVPEWTREEP